MLKITLTLSMVVFCCFFGFSQEDDKEVAKDSVILLNSRKIDTTRYLNYKGSPYYFEDFVNGTIISNSFDLFEDLEINFNGYSQEFEVRRGKEFIELDKKWYVRIDIPADKNKGILDLKEGEKIIFQRGFHAKYLNRFGNIIYNDKGVMLIKDFMVSLSEKTVQDVGKTLEFKRFDPKEFYYLIKDGEAKLLKSNRKGVIKVMGFKTELESFLKKEKIKFNKDADMKKLVAYYTTLLNS